MASNEEIKIVVTAEDKASGVLSKIGGGLSNVGKIAGGAAVAGLAAFGAFAASSFKAAAQAQQEMVIANKALENTAVKNLAEVKIKMEEVGRAAVKMGFDDEAASVAFAKLFSVTKDVAKAQEEVKLAMDLSAFSGRSLEETTKALNMVHAGGTRVLKEFGIEVKEGTTAAEAFALVQQKVGGSAEAMANTASGKMQQLSLTWQNFKEQVGETLITALTPFIDKMVAFANDPATQQRMQQIAEAVGEFARQMGPVINVLLPAMLKGLEAIVKVGSGVVKFLFVDIPNAVSAAVVKFIEITSAIERFIMRVEDAIRKAREFISTVGSNVGNAAANFGNAILPGNPFGKRAAGGPVSGGTPYLVGERGPELFMPTGAGKITPSAALTGMGNFVINITGTFLSEDAAAQLGDMLINQVKRELRI